MRQSGVSAAWLNEPQSHVSLRVPIRFALPSVAVKINSFLGHVSSPVDAPAFRLSCSRVWSRGAVLWFPILELGHRIMCCYIGPPAHSCVLWLVIIILVTEALRWHHYPAHKSGWRHQLLQISCGYARFVSQQEEKEILYFNLLRYLLCITCFICHISLHARDLGGYAPLGVTSARHWNITPFPVRWRNKTVTYSLF
jgi:hypothetical protein